MKYILFVFLVFSLLLQGISAAAGPAPEPSPFFIELWNNVSFYDTNLEKKNFSSLLGRFEGKLGLNLFHFPAQVYGVYYGVSSQAADYWNNSLYSGAGLRVMPFRSYPSSAWYNEWINDLKIFAEGLSASYLKDGASAEAAGLSPADTRYGIEIWHEWNQENPDENQLWGELWANLSNRSTNFTSTATPSTVLYFQPKVGRHLGKGIGVYLRGDLTYADKDDYWLNTAAYGIGLRFDPLRGVGETHDLFRKFKMFVEILGISYLKNKPAEANKEVASDIRFGVDLSYGR